MFAIHTKGESPTTRVFRYRSPWTGEVTEFHAERGLVTTCGCHWKTGRPYYDRVSRKTFLERALALSFDAKCSPFPEERQALRRLVAAMDLAARAAGDQGDPHVPGVGAALAARRPTTVAFGGGRPPSSYRYHPEVPPVPTAPADKPYAPLVAPDGCGPRPSRILVARR